MGMKPTFSLRHWQAELADLIVARQYARQPEVWKPYGDPGREKSLRDVGYHLTYLAEAVEASEPILFSEYLAWVKVLFANLGFIQESLSVTLDCMEQVLSERLPPVEKEAVLTVFQQSRQQFDRFPLTVTSYLEGESPLKELSRRYLQALLRMDRRKAGEMILQAVQAGTNIKDLYLHVFQPTQWEIGRLWQLNQISVAQEHFCTAATQMIMSQLYPYIFSGEPKNKRIVVACVGGELHEIGARMVADFFEMSGWDTCYLGANTPGGDLQRTVNERRPDVVALSATMTFHVSRVAQIIQEMRQGLDRPVRILVGGYPFNLSGELWQRVGADGYAADAESAVYVAEQLLTAQN